MIPCSSAQLAEALAERVARAQHVGVVVEEEHPDDLDAVAPLLELLVCDPKRLKGEAAFARCNGTAPKPASSGQTIRHRLSRGGDRQANNALHTIARIRGRHNEQTRAYLDRRISEGKTPREAMRALKRHISRSLYRRLTTIPLT
jgi:transposase